MIRVLLVGAAPLIRDALAALLAHEPDIELVGELSAFREAPIVVPGLRPDVAVIDIDGAARDGLAALRELHQMFPECRTVLLTESEQPDQLPRALALQSWGFVGKDAPKSRLLDAIRSVVGGCRFIDPELAIAAQHIEEMPLTHRELEVLTLTAGGMPVSDIASDLDLSAGTVRNYLSAAIAKLGARNRIDAVRIAQQAGWM